ncbi:MAG TPA: hypothetical protein VGF48_10245 [Thermoanaerobaculia bacterium]|jgi:hypothetical protein
MKKTQKIIAIAIAVATLAAPSLFADSRHRDRTNDDRRYGRNERRATVEGRIRSIEHERNGFVIHLNNGRVIFAARHVDVDAYGRNRTNRVRDLDRGDRIRATGVVEARNMLYVDRIQLLRDDDDRGRNRNQGYDARQITGTVQHVELNRGLLWLRDDRSGRVVEVRVRHRERDDAARDLDNLRRGDRITVGGEFQRNGEFEADRIQRLGRY